MERLAGRIILLWGWRRALAAFLAGALAVLAQAPYDFFAAGFVSFPVLVWLLDGATGRAPGPAARRLAPAFAVGWWFGFGYFLAGLWWIGGALLVEAESFAWALPLAVFGMPALLAFFYGFAAALARGCSGATASAASPRSPSAFGCAEWLRGFSSPAFRGIRSAIAAMPIAAADAERVGRRRDRHERACRVRLRHAGAARRQARPARRPGHRRAARRRPCRLRLLPAGRGRSGAAGGRDSAVRIVQPRSILREKWDGSVRDRIFQTHAGLRRSRRRPGKPAPQLILWPETSVPFLFTERPGRAGRYRRDAGRRPDAVAGAVREEGAEGADAAARYYNSVVAIDDNGEIVDAVDKVHLVPFGEYLPFADAACRSSASSRSSPGR